MWFDDDDVASAVNACPGVAVVGCGHWGANHLRVWHTLGSLRTACDADPSRLEPVTARYPGVDVTTDVADVCANPDVAAVVVATPASTHLSVALRCLEAGKDVLVEKPLALSAAEGEQLVAAAQRHGRLLMVGHVLEYHPAVVKLKQLVADGALGRVHYLYANRLNLGRIRTEENALWSFAPHDIAIMVRLVQALPESVACHGGAYLNQGVADVTMTSLEFMGNVRGHIFVSWLHPFKDHRLVVIGNRQMAVFDDTRPAGERLMLYPHRVDWRGGQLPVAHKAEGVPIALDETEPLLAECEHFLRCVETRRTPLTDGESGIRILRVLEAAQRSLESAGQPQRVVHHAAVSGYYAHPTATIDPGAEIGERTRIWHYGHVMSGARVGRDCVFGQNVFVANGVRIGDAVKIQNNVSVYEGVEIEDHVFCGPSAVFTNVINPRSEIERKEEFRPTRVRRGATLGANCTIVCGVSIGRYAFVAAGAVVTTSVPDYALVVGVPSRIVGFMCRCGVRLEFNGDAAKCIACGTRFRRRSGDNVAPDDE